MKAALETTLKQLNLDIAAAETQGDKAFFDALLAPTFAFRRANGAFDDRRTFVASVTPGADPRHCEPDSIRLTELGELRAFVTCTVTVRGKNGEDKRFHNARLFVRDATQSWRLLAWANEPAK